MRIKAGDTFRTKANTETFKYHIVVILDKEEDPQIVYKYFGKHEQWWHYQLMSLNQFQQGIKIGLYIVNWQRNKKIIKDIDK